LHKDESTKEISTLKENLAITEEERDKYRTTGVKELKDQSKQFEETIERLNDAIKEKDELLEEKERDQQNAINEID
jgi:peptidoglycan hydrolase CwlO-like protein